MGRRSCGDVACTADGCKYASHSDDTENAPALRGVGFHIDSDTPRPQWAPKHTSESPKEKTQDLVCVYVIVLNVSLHVIVLNVSVCDSVNTSSMCVCDSVRRVCE